MRYTVTDNCLRDHAAAVRDATRAHRKALALLGDEPACRAGCAHCCTHDSPPLSNPGELVMLSELVKRRADLADVEWRIVEQLAHLGSYAETANPGLLDHRGEFPCVFLDANHQCRVYEHRPIACVLTYHTDARECARTREGSVAWHRAPQDGAKLIRLMQKWLPGSKARRFEAFVPTGRAESPPLLLGLAAVLNERTKALVDEIARRANAHRGVQL